jgi:WD40 repeat protein
MFLDCRILAMSKRSIRGESSSAAHKRQLVTPEDEDPLPSASSSSTLAQQAASLSVPKMPTHLTADLILPFVADRATWNSMHSASKELHAAGKKMTPPWPNKAFNLENASVLYVAFSASGSQLAFCVYNRNTGQDVVHVWDRWGKKTLLEGHTGSVCCVEYSLDGEHLASGIGDGSIRIWSRESFHTTASQTHRERPTRTPQQADKILLGGRSIFVSLSRTDSNLLASGGLNGTIKVWNIRGQACIHSFNPGRGHLRRPIRALFFAGGADIACLAVTCDMSVIRLWRVEGVSDFASETIGETIGGVDRGGSCLRDAELSPSGSFLATSVGSRTRNESTLALCEIETMTTTQSVVVPGFVAACVAVSPDGKQLVYGGDNGRIQLLQTDDFSIQRDLDTTAE